MKCYKCEDSVDSGKIFIPVDPRGTKGRRWVCLDCASQEEKDTTPIDVVDLCNAINPSFGEKFYR